MMDIRMIALDLDGTTLNDDKVITERTRRALTAAHDKGVNIVIATGRPVSALPVDVFEIEAVRYIITSNGAAVTDLADGSRIYRNTVSPLAVDRAVELLKDTEYILEGFVDGKAYIERAYYEEIKRTRKCFRNVDYVLDTRIPVDDIYSFIAENREGIENINVNMEDVSVKDDLRKVLLTIPEATITSSFRNNLEIGGATTSKAAALTWLGEKLGVAREEMMAAGDSPNDMEMLKAAGLAVAVGNAEDEVRAIADYVSADNHHDGVAEAVEKFVL